MRAFAICRRVMTDQEAEAVVSQVVLERPGHRSDHHGHLLRLLQHLPHRRGQQNPGEAARQPRPVQQLRDSQLLGNGVQLDAGHHGLLRLGQGRWLYRVGD